VGGAGGLGAASITNNGLLKFDFTEATTLAGVIAGSGLLIQSGSAEVTLTGSNSFIGQTSVNNSILNLGSSGSLLGSEIIVQNGGTLLLGGATGGQVKNLTLNQGKLAIGGNGMASATQSLGNLTLTGNSSIEFSSLVGSHSSLSFQSIEMGNYSLHVFNYVSGATHLFDESIANGANLNLSEIYFYAGNMSSSGFLGTGGILPNSFEIVPVPESSVIVSAVMLLGWFLISYSIPVFGRHCGKTLPRHVRLDRIFRYWTHGS